MGLKDWWKSLPYWLKGGILFSAVFFFVPWLTSLILFLSFSRDQLQVIYSSGFFGSMLSILTFPQLIGTMFLGVIGYIVILVLYFLVGSIVGLTVEKLKFKK